MATESQKYIHLTEPYCKGNGVDIGSQNAPVVPWAISLDLPHDQYATYTSGQAKEDYLQWRGDGRDLPFKNGVCDFVYSSHLLEDFLDWDPVLAEWTRVLKPGGYLIILVPDKERWNKAIANGQPPNCAHTHESRAGELTEYITRLGGFKVIMDRLTDLTVEDYSILFIAQKQ